MNDKKEKRILITGSGVRVGAFLARYLAEQGYKVIIHCCQSLAPAQALLAELPGTGHQVVQCDLKDQAAAEAMFEELGKVDALLNNASVYCRSKLFSGYDAKVDSAHYQVNFLAPLTLMRAFARQVDLTDGAIVNMLDQEVANEVGLFGSYSLSKRMLKDATLAAAHELAPQIRVNAIAPGPVLPPVGLEHSKMEKTLKQVPLHRAVALADLASGCLFLLENKSMTGQILYIDGGQHLNSMHG